MTRRADPPIPQSLSPITRHFGAAAGLRHRVQLLDDVGVRCRGRAAPRRCRRRRVEQKCRPFSVAPAARSACIFFRNSLLQFLLELVDLRLRVLLEALTLARLPLDVFLELRPRRIAHDAAALLPASADSPAAAWPSPRLRPASSGRARCTLGVEALPSTIAGRSPGDRCKRFSHPAGTAPAAARRGCGAARSRRLRGRGLRRLGRRRLRRLSERGSRAQQRERATRQWQNVSLR